MLVNSHHSFGALSAFSSPVVRKLTNTLEPPLGVERDNILGQLSPLGVGVDQRREVATPRPTAETEDGLAARCLGARDEGL